MANPPDPHDTFDDTQPIQPINEDTRPTNPFRKKRRGWLRWLLGAAGLMAVLVVAVGVGLALSIETEADPIGVTLLLENEVRSVETTARTVGEVLDDEGVLVDSGDIVTPDEDTPLEPGLTISLRRARTVSLTVDGLITILRTTQTSPEAIIASAAILLEVGDRVTVNGVDASNADLSAWPEPVSSITVSHAVRLEIVDGDSTQTIYTTAGTVGEALFEAGIALFLADTVVPDVGEPVSEGLQVIVDRSRPVTIVADGRRIETRITGETVADALAEASVTLSGEDYAIPGETSALQPGMTVRIIRVTEDIATERENIGYDTVYQADANLNLDERATIQTGQTGVRERTFRVRYENGIETERTLETDTVIAEARNEVIAYGTNIVVRTLETPDGPVQYWRRLRVYATSYHPAALGGDNITATGRVLVKGIVGIDPRIIPYFTNIYVEGYGQGLAADTGGPRTTPYWIDLGYDDENFVGWSRWVDVYLLLPVPETVNYLLPYNERGGPIP